jgi:hypothetical protein
MASKQAASSRHDICYLVGILFNPDEESNLFFQMLINIYKITCCNILEENFLHCHHHVNLNSHNLGIV